MLVTPLRPSFRLPVHPPDASLAAWNLCKTALGAQHDAVFAGLQLRRQIEIAPCAFALGKLVASRTQLLPPAAVPGLIYGNALRENRCAFGGNGFESKAAPARENVAGELPEEP